ncbi:hypothetical protein MPER_04445, partial [Moniliophthora perniciosa FA553]
AKNPKTYQGALRHLALDKTPHKAAMVAAHIFDLRGAAKVGLKTIYVRRTNEEQDGVNAEDIKSKAEGGEVDVVVNSIEELTTQVSLAGSPRTHTIVAISDGHQAAAPEYAVPVTSRVASSLKLPHPSVQQALAEASKLYRETSDPMGDSLISRRAKSTLCIV